MNHRLALWFAPNRQGKRLSPERRQRTLLSLTPTRTLKLKLLGKYVPVPQSERISKMLPFFQNGSLSNSLNAYQNFTIFEHVSLSQRVNAFPTFGLLVFLKAFPLSHGLNAFTEFARPCLKP